MKICHCCTAQLEDDAQFCRNCGAIQSDAEKLFAQPVPQVEKDVFDHTGEFDPKDISDHKLFAMTVYLLDIVGIIVTLLAAKDSAYAMFHVRQGLKFTIAEMLLALAALVLCWTFIVPIAAAICAVVLVFVKLICFLSVCQGKATEPAVLRSIGFLR